MKKNTLLFSLSILFFIIQNVSAQKSSQSNNTFERAESLLKSYFELNREAIHLQFDKTTFISDEEIWFKGYVYDRKLKIPFFSTTNVYATLYDDKGVKIDEKLIYANSGNFTGNFKLNSTLKSGKYFIQVYTNWMNNFKEDESSIFQIQIINKNEPSILNYNINASNVNVVFFPEGGNLVEGISNIVGVKVSGCNNMPLPITEITIISSKSNKSQKVYLDEFGHGKFKITPTAETFKSVLNFNNEKIETYLPASSETGIALETNSYTNENEVILHLKTNKKTFDLFKEKQLYAVVNQDDKVSFLTIELNKKNTFEHTIIFSSKKMHDGVNTITIVDNDLKKLAERQIFKYPESENKLSYQSYKKSNDTIAIFGKLNSNNVNLSLSILPENSISDIREASIFTSFLLTPYLESNNFYTNYSFNYTSRANQYKLDLLLLNQKTLKYKWEDIKINAPQKIYEFEYGITLKGTINQVLNENKENYKVQLFSLKSGINESAPINEKNEFYFNNLVIANLTEVDLTLIEGTGKLLPLKVYPQILNAKSQFNKALKPSQTCSQDFTIVDIDIPSFQKNTITLDQIEIKKDRKTTFKHQNNIGNNFLKAYKFDETDNNNNISLLQFIEGKGFEVINNTISLQIYSRISPSLNGNQRSKPEIYIDNFEINNFDLLLDMRLDEIEEVYISSTITLIPSMRNRTGTIKIYRKKGASREPNYKKYSVSYIFQNGFSKIENFKQNNYATTDNKGFQNFGVVNWIPNLATQRNGEFKFVIPDMNQKKVKVLVEGFSAEGKLISEVQTIELQ